MPGILTLMKGDKVIDTPEKGGYRFLFFKVRNHDFEVAEHLSGDLQEGGARCNALCHILYFFSHRVDEIRVCSVLQHQ